MRPLRRLGARGRSGPPFFRRPVARFACRRRLLLCLLFAKPYFRWPTAAGFHLFPFRTEKLSPPAPMVLRQRESRSPPFFFLESSAQCRGGLFFAACRRGARRHGAVCGSHSSARVVTGPSAGRTLPGRCRGRKQRRGNPNKRRIYALYLVNLYLNKYFK